MHNRMQHVLFIGLYRMAQSNNDSRLALQARKQDRLHTVFTEVHRLVWFCYTTEDKFPYRIQNMSEK